MSRGRRWTVIVAALAVIGAASAVLIPGVRARSAATEAARLAREAVEAGREAEARPLLDRWSSFEPKGGEPDYYRARLEVHLDRPAEAMEAMRRSLALGHAEGPLRVLRAILLARAGQLEAAEPALIAAFREGVEPKADVAEALSRIFLKTFRLGEAGRVLDVWMVAAPEDPRPYLRLNEVAERTDSDPEVQVRNYREALRRDPALNAARLALAEKLRDGSKIDEAEVEYATLLARDPKNVAGLVGAGRVALLKGDLTAATRHYEDALAIDPREKVALRELGLIDLNAGRTTKARDRLKAAVEVDPFDPEVRYSYSRALKATGDEARSAEEAAETERLKREQQTIVDLRKGLVERPDDIELRCAAALWLIAHGHDKEGLDWARLVLRQRPGHPAACKLLADYHEGRREFGLANFYRTAASTESLAP